MVYSCPGCGQTDEEKKNCCGEEMVGDEKKPEESLEEELEKEN